MIGKHFLAAMHGDIEKLELFVTEENINERYLATQSTLLDMAVSRNHVEATEWLLNKGSNIYLHGANNSTVLHIAIGNLLQDKYKKEDVVKIIQLLLSHERKIREKNPKRYANTDLLKDTKFNNCTVPLSIVSRHLELKDEVENLISRYGYQPEDSHKIDIVSTELRQRKTKKTTSPEGVLHAPQALFSRHLATDHTADQEHTALLTRNSPTSSQPNITTCRSDVSSNENLMQKIRSFFSLT